MNKKGIALIFGLFAITVLSVLVAIHFSRTMNENNWVKRETNSWRAFWLAEAGAAHAISLLTSVAPVSGTLQSNPNYQYNATVTQLPPVGAEEIYQIDSTGTVLLDGGATSIQREVELVVSVTPPDPGDFDYALEVNGDLKLGGSADVFKDLDGDGEPDDDETGEDISYNTYAGISFTDRLGLSSEEVESAASSEGTLTLLKTGPSKSQDVPTNITDQIHWVNMQAPVTQARVPTVSWYGSGILIVNGEFQMEGGLFEGIIWVIGKLTISGNAEVRGAIIAECEADIQTSVTGNPVIQYDYDAIQDALELLEDFSPRTIRTWREK